MPATSLLLLRHGHTDSNGGAAPRMSGWTDYPLSELGRHEAELLGAHLSGGAGVSAIYSSPLERARATAEPLERRGLGAVILCAGLQEIDCGEVDGWAVEEVKRRFPEHWAANLRQDDDEFRWPGGESYQELRRRCLRAIGRIAARHPGERVAVVTHAGVICQIVGHLRGRPAARWEAFRPENASITEVRWSGDRGEVISFNERSHLRAPRAAAVG